VQTPQGRAAEPSAPDDDELLNAIKVLPAATPVVSLTAADNPTARPALVIEAFTDPPIYSAESIDVVPPVSIMPPLPPELPASTDPLDLGRIELIIGTDGSVESVRLVAVLRNVQHSILLSAVKAWQFEPALKDGVPVRYRETVWVGSGSLGEPFSWRIGH
jgi:hypothetical protein